MSATVSGDTNSGSAIIWLMFVPSSGRGWLVGVVTVGCLLLSDFLTSLHFHDANYYSQHGWPKLAVKYWGVILFALGIGFYYVRG